jgi:hypothetical protein
MQGKVSTTTQDGAPGTVSIAVQGSQRAQAVPATAGRARDWQLWAPYAAIAWSLIYGVLGMFWLVSGRGFPYTSTGESAALGPLAGLPAAALGAAMLRGMHGRLLRPLFITAGVLLAGILLLLMTDINLLIVLGYTPLGLFSLLTGAELGQVYLEMLRQWTLLHQLLCLSGGFLWLGATVTYARRSAGACLYCGRQDSLDGWNSPAKAARWGRIAVFVAILAPVFYALTRYAWVLGFPLGISTEYLRSGQESGTWISGLSLATFGLVGAYLMLGLVQRWGEVFPRWILGLGGRQVPMGLAVVPAAIVAVLLIVGGITVWSDYDQLAANALATGHELWIVVGPILFFPVWGAALALATLGYYFRRRGLCKKCGRGAPGEAG